MRNAAARCCRALDEVIEDGSHAPLRQRDTQFMERPPAVCSGQRQRRPQPLVQQECQGAARDHCDAEGNRSRKARAIDVCEHDRQEQDEQTAAQIQQHPVPCNPARTFARHVLQDAADRKGDRYQRHVPEMAPREAAEKFGLVAKHRADRAPNPTFVDRTHVLHGGHRRCGLAKREFANCVGAIRFDRSLRAVHPRRSHPPHCRDQCRDGPCTLESVALNPILLVEALSVRNLSVTSTLISLQNPVRSGVERPGGRRTAISLPSRGSRPSTS